jgi:hypothetical protein
MCDYQPFRRYELFYLSISVQQKNFSVNDLS